MTTEEKIAHNRQIEQDRLAYHKRRCEESEAYRRVYERMMGKASHDAMQSQSVANAIQACCQWQVAQQMPNTTEQPVRSHEAVMAERKAMKDYELLGIQNSMYGMCAFWMFQKMTEDKQFRDDFLSDFQAMKEISEVEEAYDLKLERFGKYEL